jgi:purine-nucleoside phosphorylase
MNGRTVVAQRGRFHFYEGYSMQTVTLAIRVFAALGVRVVVVTNAAGGLNPTFHVADVMLITDHISLPCLSGNHPLVGSNDARFGPRFPPVNGIYHPVLQAAARDSASALGLASVWREGTYFHDSGPTYESPSEVRAMRLLGGDAVGMSTVPEVVVAAHCGMAVVGLSLITNECRAPGDTGIAPSHEEVLEASDKRAADMQRLVADMVGRIDPAAYPQSLAASVFAPGAPVFAKTAPAPAAARAGTPEWSVGQWLAVAAIAATAGVLSSLAMVKAMRRS